MQAASVAIFVRTRVLLIERAFAPAKGLWTFPGGRQEAGETAKQTARREIAEELGIAAGPLIPVTVETVPGFTLNVFATALPERPTLALSAEIADYCWTARMELDRFQTTPGLEKIFDMALKALE